MPTLDLFLPLTKVDVDARMVHGVATAESPDRAGEICDYETTKPYFQSWSEDTHASSGGKSGLTRWKIHKAMFSAVGFSSPSISLSR